MWALRGVLGSSSAPGSWPPWALPFGGTSRAPAAGQAGAEGALESEARRESGVNRSPTSAGCNTQGTAAVLYMILLREPLLSSFRVRLEPLLGT